MSEMQPLSNVNEYALELNALSVGYNTMPLHEPFSLSVHAGEIVALIGPNGSGKSTLLKTIIQQLAPVCGTVVIDGKESARYRPKELSKTLSVLLTRAIRPELLTCRDVVASGRYPHTGYFGVLTQTDREKVDEALREVQADSFADKEFTKVSDGQRQRIMFARALCQEPRILILDEPTSYLDIHWRLEMLSLLRKRAARGVCVIASLHEIDLALKLSDRIICVGSQEIRELSKDHSERDAELRALYDITDEYFDPELGFSELAKVQGNARYFVISSNGKGIETYRTLQKKGIPFAAGILYPNDAEYRVAKALAVDIIEATPYEPIDERSVENAKKCIDSCEKVINMVDRIGSMNERLLDIVAYAGEKLCQLS